jgi:hypothetical protein
MRFLILLFALLFIAPSLARAEDRPLNPYIALVPQPVSTPIIIDGVLEDAWFEAAHFDNFAEYMPSDKIAAQVATEGYITHDGDHLFVAFICYDPDMDKLRASLTDRDQIYGDDFVGIVIDTYRDQQRAYEFFSNAHGIQGDMLWNANNSERDGNGAIWQANGGEDESFDAGWEAETAIYEDHWTVEMKIPLSNLRYPNQSEQDWAVHFVRVYPRENRYQFSWMPISQDHNSFMGQAGGVQLTLGEAPGSANAFEFIPFITGSRTDQLVDGGAGNGVWRNQDGGRLNASERLGFTGQYTLSSDQVVDFAFRPDFSQLESDAGRVEWRCFLSGGYRA